MKIIPRYVLITVNKTGEFNGEEVFTGSYKAGSNSSESASIYFTMYRKVDNGDIRFHSSVKQELIPFLKEKVLEKITPKESN